MYTVYSNNMVKGYESVDEIRKKQSSFSLWIDLEKREIVEQTKGHIDVFSKRILGRLLCFLVMNAGKKYAFDKLYEDVWMLPIYNLSEENKVKVSISRLRSLIEPHENWQYILKTEPILGFKGEYYFNPDACYCLIIPHNMQLFRLGN